MPSNAEKVLAKKWETVVKFGFLQLYDKESNLDTSNGEQNRVEFETAHSAASDISGLISRDDLTLVGKVHSRIRGQVEKYLKKKILPKVKRGEKRGILLEILGQEWNSYAIFKDWLGALFSSLNEKIRPHGVLEDCNVFVTERLASVCFKSIVVSPFSSSLAKEVSRKFDSHINCVNATQVEANLAVLGQMGDMLRGISRSEPGYSTKFIERLVSYRVREYHQMGSNWVKSLCLEDFARCILRHFDREKIAGRVCFDASIRVPLQNEAIQVFFGTYLSRSFWKNREQYATWVREETISPLEGVNKVIVRNEELIAEVTEIFRVSLLEKICSALRIQVKPFLTNVRGFRSPFHIFCAACRHGGIFRKLVSDVFCLDQTMDAMLTAFHGHANLLKAFSASESLKGQCESILKAYVQQCGNCLLPSMFQSFCRSSLSKNGRVGVSPQVLSYHGYISIFMKFVPRPDPFQKAYFEDFYKRLMDNKLASAEAEQMILSAFSHSSEHDHILKGSRMLRNHVESQKLFDIFSSSSFCAASREQNHVKFRVNLFRRGTLERATSYLISTPREIRECHLSYEDFFRSRRDDAKLEWNYRLGVVTVQTQLFTRGPRKWTVLELNVEQFSVLDLFQERESLSFRNILETIIIDTSSTDDSEKALGILACVIQSLSSPLCPLLKKIPETTSFEGTDTIMLNTSFLSYISRIEVPKPKYDEVPQVCAATEKKPDQMSMLRIESAIVSTMKELRRSSREHLFSLVAQKIARFLEVDSIMFDECVEKLVDREFIAPEDGIASCFTYVL